MCIPIEQQDRMNKVTKELRAWQRECNKSSGKNYRSALIMRDYKSQTLKLIKHEIGLTPHHHDTNWSKIGWFFMKLCCKRCNARSE